jgi:hypothetical protein
MADRSDTREARIAEAREALKDPALLVYRTTARMLLAEVDALEAERATLRETCPFCGHLWRQHDPEDGKCDSHSDEKIGVCECGRDLDWMQVKIAGLARTALVSGETA